MINNRQKTFELAKKFKTICEKNNVWYSLDKETMLGIIRHGGFVPWYEKFNIIVSVDGFNKLKRVVPNMIVDSSTNEKHKSLVITFVDDNKSWETSPAFLEISIAVPTTKENIRKFSSISRRIWAKITMKKDNIKHAIDDLYEPNNFQGYLRLTKRKEYLEEDWIQVLSFKTVTKKFNNTKFNVAKEYDAILENLFGEDYMEAKVPKKWYEYPFPLQKVKVD